jgi:HD-like signal output (HDOD) protein
MLPHVASRVMSLTRNPDADRADLSTLIHQDQNLAGNVVRIAHSAVYCHSEPFVSLRQAVLQLGMTTLGKIALVACLKNDAFVAPGYEHLLRNRLTHALVSWGLAKELAWFKRSNVEVAFLGGLLHRVAGGLDNYFVRAEQVARSAR